MPNVDIVVNPPKTPVPRKRIVSVWTDAPMSAPNRKAPSRFTTIVAHGTSSDPADMCSAILHRATEPIAPPKPTSAAGCILLAGADGVSYFLEGEELTNRGV